MRSRRRHLHALNAALVATLALAWAPALAARADEPSPADERPWLVAGQVTAVGLVLPGFRSPYSNPALSFGPGPDTGGSIVGTLYVGSRLWRGATAVLEGEWADGGGLPNVSGVSGYPDANIIRVAKVGHAPYFARAFVQQEIALGGDGGEANEPPASPEDPFSLDGPWALRRRRPPTRLTFTLGKFSTPDFFDAAEASTDPRHRFMNWAVMTNGAWDYAADTRGYTWGAAAVLATPRWALRAGLALMPTEPNGPVLDWNLRDSRSEMVEGQVLWALDGKEGSLRLLGYFNHSRAARYSDALAAAPAGTAPDLAPYRRPGATKRGVGLLVEQETGPARIFVRASWNDGATETFAFTEIDRAASGGAEIPVPGLAGQRDSLGAAIAVGGLSPDHARFLAAGGHGFQLGDGALRQAAETIVEVYYLVRAPYGVELTADVQAIWNPGMNADRGPAAVFGLRVHAHR
jgi:hypothetical protein